MSPALMAALTTHLQTCKAYWRSADSCWEGVVIPSNWMKIDYGSQPPREESRPYQSSSALHIRGFAGGGGGEGTNHLDSLL